MIKPFLLIFIIDGQRTFFKFTIIPLKIPKICLNAISVIFQNGQYIIYSFILFYLIKNISLTFMNRIHHAFNNIVPLRTILF